jgi:DNA polymerase IV (DinB-like DNA polymerase)
MPLYRAVSGRLMQILQRYADAFEEASIDEAYLDVSSLETFAAARQRMTELKAEIHDLEGLGCSVGTSASLPTN